MRALVCKIMMLCCSFFVFQSRAQEESITQPQDQDVQNAVYQSIDSMPSQEDTGPQTLLSEPVPSVQAAEPQSFDLPPDQLSSPTEAPIENQFNTDELLQQPPAVDFSQSFPEQTNEEQAPQALYNAPDVALGLPSESETVTQLPSPELAPAPEPIPVPDVPTESLSASSMPEEVSEIDTMNLEEPKGNWLFKRFWWEKAERTYEKIKNLVDKISETRLSFFQQRTDLDRTLFDPFYLNIGFEQGELRALNEFFQNELQQERLARGTLTLQERTLLQKLTTEKQLIQSMQNDMDVVRKVDMSIDDALSKLIERISEVRSYERQAWDRLKAINRELSDLKAHEYYLAMDAFWKNINNINNYIAHDFTNYFAELVQKANTEVDRVKTAVELLREKGIDLKASALQLRSIGQKPAEEPVEDEEEVIEEVSWYSSIWNTITWPFKYIYNFVTGFFAAGTDQSDNNTPDDAE